MMRAGYGARGAIYIAVGALAFLAALNSGQAEGTKDALVALRKQPYGVPMLWGIGLGLFCYMVWRVVAGIMDVEDHGDGAKGAFARAAQITTGLLHGGIAISVIGLAQGGGGGGDSTQDWTQKVMQMPLGRTMVGIGALILVGAGLYYAYKGVAGKYKEHLANARLVRDLEMVIKGGLIVYGAMLVLVGISIATAAFFGDPSQAGGLGQALQSLRGAVFGRILLGGAGIGLLAFALYNFVEAGYRVVPKISGAGIKTLADRATS